MAELEKEVNRCITAIINKAIKFDIVAYLFSLTFFENFKAEKEQLKKYPLNIFHLDICKSLISLTEELWNICNNQPTVLEKALASHIVYDLMLKKLEVYYAQQPNKHEKYLGLTRLKFFYMFGKRALTLEFANETFNEFLTLHRTSSHFFVVSSPDYHKLLMEDINSITRFNVANYKNFLEALENLDYSKALRITCLGNYYQLTEILLKYKDKLNFDLNEVEVSTKRSSAHFAGLYAFKEIYALLIQYGANIHIPDSRGRTAEDYMNDHLKFEQPKMRCYYR